MRQAVYGYSWPFMDHSCYLPMGTYGKCKISGNLKPEGNRLCDHKVNEGLTLKKAVTSQTTNDQ